VICGYKIDAGSIIAINPYMMHHHPKFWKDPETYNPDRFSEDEAKKMHKFVYFPFGGGPRICIGRDFAMTELMLSLAMVIQKHDLALTSGWAVRAKANMTLSPDPGVRVRLLPRERSFS
jgi:cytochrome P450